MTNLNKGVEVWFRSRLSERWEMGVGVGADWHFSYLRFIIFTFRNYFTLCKIVLCI